MTTRPSDARRARANALRDVRIGRRNIRLVRKVMVAEGRRVADLVEGSHDAASAIRMAEQGFLSEPWREALSALWADAFVSVWPSTFAEITGLKGMTEDRGMKGRRLDTLLRLLDRLTGGDGRIARGSATVINRHVDQIIRSSKSSLQGVLTRGDTGGAGAARAVRRLYRGWSGSRVARIAVAEALQAAAVAQHEAAISAEAAVTYKVERTWHNVGDTNVRETHVTANGQRRPLDQPFLVGGHLLKHPRDPSGPSQEIINCRCSETYRRIKSPR